MLEKIIDIQKVGRFKKLKVQSSLHFLKTTLIFGENGWGKSTIADILRSFGSNRPEIILGRKTLATDGTQKIHLRFAKSRMAIFENAVWNGTPPPIAVFDQTFINENIYSGEFVSHEHLKHQYGLVIGEEGIAIHHAIQKTEVTEKDTKNKLNEQEQAIQAITAGLGLPQLPPSKFAMLLPLPDATMAIDAKETEHKQAIEYKQILNATLPKSLDVPTPVAELKSTLKRSVESVAAEARGRVQKHIAAHAKEGGDTSVHHETWLEAGLAFAVDETCPFCGQEFRDRDLVDLYSNYFNAAFKALAEDVKRRRQTLALYDGGEFRNAVCTTIRANAAAIENLTNLTMETFSGKINGAALIGQLEKAAREMDAAFLAKQEDLISTLDLTPYADVFAAWNKASDVLVTYNRSVQDYLDKIEAIRCAQEGANVEKLTHELAHMTARVKRYDNETESVIAIYNELLSKQSELKQQKKNQRDELRCYSSRITDDFGSTINDYLKRLSAGFRIKYERPTFKGQEPAAAYVLMINETPVPLRSNDVATPSFRNTLSTSDKFVLALAFFLATVNADPKLSESIVVLDDPFTSMDAFRRRFTANEINKLCINAAQVIVLSHEMSFLQLLLERAERTNVITCAIQTGTPEMVSLVDFDIAQATKPREKVERDKVFQFLDVGDGDPDEIRGLLRTVLEDFYRKGDPERFTCKMLLSNIIREIRAAPPEYRYKGAVDKLEDINRFSCEMHHGPVSGSATEPTSIEELKSYCQSVWYLTHGSV